MLGPVFLSYGQPMDTMSKTPTPAPTPGDHPTSSTASARWGWRAFVAVAVLTALIGLFFAASMDPTGGPYTMDERYPFGSALRTWQVTVGFDWIAYAILFGAAGSVARRTSSRPLWAALAVSFVIIWFPHVAIGVAFLVTGS